MRAYRWEAMICAFYPGRMSARTSAKSRFAAPFWLLRESRSALCHNALKLKWKTIHVGQPIKVARDRPIG
jgi:hypothetical protein